MEDAAAVHLRRGARVVAVVGDGAGKAAKLDLRAATRVLLAAQKANASQFVLVAPVGSAGFLASLFGGGIGGGSGSGSPSKLEQDLAASGLDFIVIRTGRTDVQDSEFEAANNVAVGTQGALPSQARITKNQANVLSSPFWKSRVSSFQSLVAHIHLTLFWLLHV